jgi:two-component system CheB/CheR fusion protein
MLEKVFDLFTQIDRSLSSASQWGLGIGLALVRTLVEMHGGSARAHSAGPGQGSAFVIRLPVLGREPPAEGTAPSAGEGPGAGEPTRQAKGDNPTARRVLVVDDSGDAAQSLAMLLRIQGHDVTVALDGPGALEAARQHRPEVVLLDIGLPGVDGYEVAARLRREPGTQGAFLVAMTGYGQEEDRRRSREAGFDCHLVKPVDPEDLRRLLDRREARLVRGER